MKRRTYKLTRTPTVVERGGVDGPPLDFPSVKTQRHRFTLDSSELALHLLVVMTSDDVK